MYSRKFLLLTLVLILVGVSSLGAAPPEYLLIEEPQEPVETEIGPVMISFRSLNDQGVILGAAHPTDLTTDVEQLIVDPLECTLLAVRFAPNRKGVGKYELLDPSDDSQLNLDRHLIGPRGHVTAEYAPTDPAFVFDDDGQPIGLTCGPEFNELTLYRFGPDGGSEAIPKPRRFDPLHFYPQEILAGGELMVWYYDSQQGQTCAYLYVDGEWLWLNQVDRMARNAIVRDIAPNGNLLFHRGIPGGGQEGVVYYAEDGFAEKLPHLGGGTTVPAELDAKGRVIGGSFVDAREYHAFVYSREGGMRDLHLPGYRFSIALERTSRGAVIGYLDERPGNDYPDTIFRYDEKRGMRVLVSAAEFESLLPSRAEFLGIGIEGINDRLEILGLIYWEDPRNDSTPRTTTFYYSPRAGLFDVQGFVDAAGGDFEIRDFSEPQLSGRGDILLTALPNGSTAPRELLLKQTKKAR